MRHSETLNPNLKILFNPYMKYLLLFILFTSCSINSWKSPENVSSKKLNYYLFKDISGQYVIKREVIQNQKQLVVRQELFTPGKEENPLEKTVTVTKFGVVKIKKKNLVASRPWASQYSIWFEEKEFFSQMKLNVLKKGFDVYLKSPEEKWKGKQFVSLPRGLKFCWFSQVVDCVKRIVKLDQKSREPTSFYIVWDGFPYYSEQLQNLSGNVYSLASIYYDGEFEKTHRFAVKVENQIIFYHFNYEYEFERMFWVAQAITMIKN